MRKTIHLMLFIFMMTSLHALQGQNLPANSPAAINGPLKVIGTKLCNQYDKPIQLRGMSTHGLQWFYNSCYANSKTAAFDALKNWGADIIRISMYVQEDGYETDPTGYTNKVKALIDIATARGMYALVDFHQLDPGDPNYNTARAKTFFTAIASAYKNHTNVLYDICNEPNGNGVTWAVIKNYADQVIPVIRAIDNDAVISVGTDGWATFGLSRTGSSNTYKDVVNNKLNFPNVLYSFHFYADSHRDSYLNLLDVVSNELPVFVTEFGFQNSAGEGTNNRAMSDKYITLMRNKKISWCNWNFSDDNRSGAVWKSGTCSSNNWSDANLKEAGLWAKEYISSPADDFPTGTVNQSPTVSLTAPANNATYTAPAAISISANAADADGSVAKVEFYNGTTLLNTDATAPYAYTWNGVAAGTYSITAKATDNAGATKTSTAVTVTVNPVTVTQSPYGGTATNIPGTIEAAKYDIGGQNIAYYDNTTGNSGSTFRTEDVDIEASTEGGYNIGWTAANEWTEYTVNATAGTYKIEARVAATAAGKSFRIEMDGATVATIAVPNTGDWQAWQTVTVNNVSLSAGQKVMRIYNITDGFNLSNIKFSVATTPPTGPVIAYQNCNNDPGYAIGLNVGNYTTAQLIALGIVDNDISRVTVQAGYQVILYADNNFSGNSVTLTSEASCLTNNNFNDVVSSVKVSLVTTTNQAPTVSLTAPSNNATYTAPASVTISANASDADGTVSKVEFYNGSTLLNTDNSSPYSYSWNNVAAGTYTITAKATDNSGATTTSSTVTVSVTNASNQAPSVSLTAPTNNATYNAPTSITISANASDADGTISKVEFYNGSTLLNTDNSSPYSYSWTNVAAGTYTITAKATDNSGATTTSASRTVTVKAASTGGCSGLAQYAENAGYVPGSKVQNAGSQYECKPFPYSGWCNGAAWAYGPGVGAYWTDAWTLVGTCNARMANTENNTIVANVNETVLTNSPNPFHDLTAIEVSLYEESDVNIAVYNKAGQIVATVLEGHLNAGTHALQFDSKDLTPGLYIVKCSTNSSVVTRKIVKN